MKPHGEDQSAYSHKVVTSQCLQTLMVEWENEHYPRLKVRLLGGGCQLMLAPKVNLRKEIKLKVEILHNGFYHT